MTLQKVFSCGETRQKILLVEDQYQVRQSTTLILEHAGFDVFAAEHATEAMRIFRESPGIDLVMSDVELPGASGLQLREVLRQEAPWVRVLLTSGHIGERDFENAETQTYFLGKPYARRDLISKIDEMMAPPLRARAAAQAG